MQIGIRGFAALALAATVVAACSSGPQTTTTSSVPGPTSAGRPSSVQPSSDPAAVTSTPAPAAATVTRPPAGVMDLAQIAAGNYASMLGTWTEEAYSFNPQNGTGVQWKSGGTDTLTVAADKLVNKTQDVQVQGDTLTAGATGDVTVNRLAYQTKGSFLEASLVNQDAAINWQLGFYPKGSVDLDKHLTPGNGVTLSGGKNTIYIWTSNDSYAEVFVQTVALSGGAGTAPASPASSPAHLAACLSKAGFTRVLATPGITVTQIIYCSDGLALTGASACASQGVCNANEEVFQATGGRWRVSSKVAVCNGADSPIPTKYQWFCNSD